MSSSKQIYELRRVAGIIKPSDVVYTDPLSTKALQFFWKYPQSMRTIDFEGMSAHDIQPNSYVLADEFRLDWLNVNVDMWLTNEYGYHEPEFVSKPPETWKRIWQNRHAVLYKVD